MTDNANILITEKLVMKNCKLTFEEAEDALWKLIDAEIVELDYTEGKRKYKALITRADYDLFWELLAKKHLSNDVNGCCVKKNLLGNYDLMSGLEFENFCITVMERIGFFNIETTSVTGDHGIDILAEKDGISYAIQCKCYSSKVGNAAIQQAHTGKSIYRRDIAVVLTNQYFTNQAIEEAKTLGVKLWDRDKLDVMIEEAGIL